MRNEARGDVWKVWVYAAAAVALGAWMSPLLYNAGKALAEVSSAKTTNGPLEWLAGVCRAADFPQFYKAALLLAAVILFLPWMEWIHARSGTAAQPGPWKVRLPDGARVSKRGQALRRGSRSLWQCCAGFLLVAGLLLSMGVALVPAGFFTLRNPAEGMGLLAVKTLGGAFALAVVMEVFFRGVAMGIFLRAMRPAVAMGMSAVFFALVLSAVPADGVNVADPDAAGTGFELLGIVAVGLREWRGVVGNLVPLLALGAVLAYARWRMQSLWLPIGLHTGWIFSKGMLASLSSTGATVTTGGLFQQGFVPFTAIILAGLLAHYLIAQHEDETPVRS